MLQDIRLTEFNNIIFKTHVHGMGYLDPSKRYFYVNIPKNATTWTRNVLCRHGWSEENFNSLNISELKFFCGIRDPLERWISGAAEFLNRRSHQFDTDFKSLVHLLVHFKTLDEHTVDQRCLLDGLNIDNITFFNINVIDYKQDIFDFMTNRVGQSVDESNCADIRQNITSEYPTKYTYWHKIRMELNSDIELYHRLLQSLSSECLFYAERIAGVHSTIVEI
jgi:hypothetical protein